MEPVLEVNRAFSAGRSSLFHESWSVAPGSPQRIRPVADWAGLHFGNARRNLGMYLFALVMIVLNLAAFWRRY
jgi:hypothetical protein